MYDFIFYNDLLTPTWEHDSSWSWTGPPGRGCRSRCTSWAGTSPVSDRGHSLRLHLQPCICSSSNILGWRASLWPAASLKITLQLTNVNNQNHIIISSLVSLTSDFNRVSIEVNTEYIHILFTVLRRNVMVFVRAESANKSYSMNLDLLQAALMHMCREQIILIQRKEKVNQSEHSRVFEV